MDIDTTRRGTSQIGEILLLGVEEIIGQPGLISVFNLIEQQPRDASRYDDPALRIGTPNAATIAEGLEKLYGPSGGRGVVLRAGRAGFKYLLRHFGPATGMFDLKYRMLPVPARMRTGLQALAALLAQLGDESVTISEYDNHWTWTADRCPHCWQRKTDAPACYFPVGLLQEFFSWASSGRVYGIREIECMAAGGPACVIQINKKAIE